MPLFLTPWIWRFVWLNYDKLPKRCASQTMVTSTFLIRNGCRLTKYFHFRLYTLMSWAVSNGTRSWLKPGLAVPIWSYNFWTPLVLVCFERNVFRYYIWNISIWVKHRHQITSIFVNCLRSKASEICWMFQSPSVLWIFLSEWLL